MRYAIYARYSSDLQSDRSIDDQVSLCRAHAGRLWPGGACVEVYADRAVSGSHLKGRPRAQALLADARAGRFEAILAEALDRLTRDQEDAAGIFKRLSFAGVKLVTVSEGEIDELHVGLKGTMNALYLKDLRAKIRRGMAGRARDGLVASGLSYGYRVVRAFDAGGEKLRGRREIVPDRAAVVRRIFRDYARGLSPRAIAHALNREGVPSPSGREWGPATINGCPKRRTGILHNEFYRGRMAFNRQSFVEDPDTGRKRPRWNDPKTWIWAEVPELRIVDEDLWEAAQRVKRAAASRPLEQRRRPKRLFSGLVFCACCGARYTVKSGDKLACVAHRERGTCANGRIVRAGELERRVLAAVRERLVAPDALEVFAREYARERRRLAALPRLREASGRRPPEKRLAAVERRLGNVAAAIAELGHSARLAEDLKKLEAEKAALEEETRRRARSGADVVRLPDIAGDCRRRLAELRSLFAGPAAPGPNDAGLERAQALLRPLTRRIEVHPLPGRGKVDLELHADLAAVLALANPPPAGAPGTVMMVAGEGFEPPTKGL
jgi:site-specific DNA recombinase